MKRTMSIEALEAEVARLKGLLEAHGIEWRPLARDVREGGMARGAREKVALFRGLFHARSDVYALRWESATSGRSGYAPACANEWRPGVCRKPQVACSACDHRELVPLSNAVFYRHLTGQCTVGIYPLLTDESCGLLAVDFDEAQWREDARAFVSACKAMDVPVSLEVSRSGSGAHAWIFFEGTVPARDARRLGVALISEACARTGQLKLNSYDRLFPNQDTMPKGGYGNLIALPLQKDRRAHGATVFVDESWRPYDDQWGYLAGIRRMRVCDIESAILRATGGAHPLDVAFIEDAEGQEPWARCGTRGRPLPGPLPATLTVRLADRLYFEKAELTPVLAQRLIRLAVFANPEFYKAQALRLSVWDKPRLIGCAENFPRHIALPRGCLQAVRGLLQEHGIGCEFRDERFAGAPLSCRFTGRLRPDQEQAAAAVMGEDMGVLCAATAFGKTVVAAAVIARRAVNTLILVHRTDLLRQWRERLTAFLEIDDGAIGIRGDGKDDLRGMIDVAMLQSLGRREAIDPAVGQYGHVIVDECHHVSAASFEEVLRAARARYVLGLTATPIRRDGRQPVIFLQCGPIRHRARKSSDAPADCEVIPRVWEGRGPLSPDTGIQDVFRLLAHDRERSAAIAVAVERAFTAGRKILVLTERCDHLEALAEELRARVTPLFVLQGRMSRKARVATRAALEALPADAARVVLATGRLVGEGFDHPPLDTLVLAMPVSWRGTLQQYAGRLHRAHPAKTRVEILDFVDTGHPALGHMWAKRRQGYRAMGYRLREPSVDADYDPEG